MNTIHQFKVNSIDGNIIDFSTFQGKKIIVVNVASECGYTPQYQQLEELYREAGDKVVIVAFPSNEFGGQEPGTNEEIKAFCTTKYNVTFPMAAKAELLGANGSEVYQWLLNKSKNGKLDSELKWNFQKYLLDEQGTLVNFFPSSVSPLDEQILNWIAS